MSSSPGAPSGSRAGAPAPVIFFGHGLDAKLRSDRFTRRGVTTAALMDSIRDGESAEDVKARVGKPAQETRGADPPRPATRRECGDDNARDRADGRRPLRAPECHSPSYSGEPVARIYEFEVYGPDGKVNLALQRPATGSQPCSPDQGPEKAVNGSVAGGQADRWCAQDRPLFLQVDLGAVRPVTRFVVKHASAGGEKEESDTRDFNIQLSTDGRTSPWPPRLPAPGSSMSGPSTRELVYFDGRREARLHFADGKLQGRHIHSVLDFEEDRAVFAGIFRSSTCGSRSSSAVWASS